MANLYSYQGPEAVWSDEQQEPLYQHSGAKQAFGWGKVAALGAGALFAGSHTFADGETGFTKAYRASKVAERFILPAGMASTFRVPGFISPFVQHSKIVESTGKAFKPIWSAGTFNSQMAQEMIAGFLGVEQSKLIGAATHGMEWVEYGPNSHLGKMVELKTGKVIQENVRLEQRGASREISRKAQAVLAMRAPDTLEKYRNLQDAARDKAGKPLGPEAARKAVAKAMVDITEEAVDEDFFYHVDSKIDKATGKIISRGRHSEFFPVHVSHSDRLGRGGSLAFDTARTVLAEGSGRLNELIRTLEQQVPVLSDIIGELPFRLYGKEGTALRNMAMYGGRAGAVMAGGLAISTASWAKRQNDASGMLGFGVAGGYLASLVGGKKAPILRAGAAAAAASLLPVFKHGLLEGIGGIFATLNQGRGLISNAFGWTPIIGSDWRRFWESAAPGSTEASTAAGMGILGVGVGMYMDRKLRPEMFAKVNPTSRSHLKGFEKALAWGHSKISSSGTHFWNLYGQRRAGGFARPGAAVSSFQEQLQDAAWAINEQSKQRGWSSSGTADVPRPSWMSAQIKHDHHWADRIVSETNPVRRVGEQIKAAWHGAEPGGIVSKSDMGKNWWRQATAGRGVLGWSLPFKSKHMNRFVAVATAFAVFTGKVFATSESNQRLSDIYSGKELLPQRKGRWWEGGGTAWEGGAISHFKPHWLPLAKSRAVEKSVWGEEQAPGDWLDLSPSPIGKLFRKHFTYELEEMHYRDRPYPITGQAFEEVPFMKWLLDPIGKLIKPAKLMHVDEWARYNDQTTEVELKHMTDSMEIQPAYDLGGIRPGAPDSPFEGKRRFGQFYYQNVVEGPGLWGFTAGLIGKYSGGVDVPFTQGSVLQSAGNIDSTTRKFWGMNLGGFGFLSEPVRRFFPRPLSALGKYNPIANTMPSWMPDELKYGDPYAKVTGGEYRLPGAGYAAMHEELDGTDPETYPLVYKYSILADVAPWSEEFRIAERQVRYKVGEGLMSDAGLEFIQRADRQMKAKRMKREYHGYINSLNEETKSLGIIGKPINFAWKGAMNLLHDIASPIEKLAPLGIRPIEKLFPYLDAVGEYEDTALYGTRLAFWGIKESWRDWFRPFINQSLHDYFGWDGIPKHVKEVRALSEYYDKLEYYKWKGLEEGAQEEGDYEKSKLYSKLAKRTVAGVNPFDRIATVKAALPKEEQEFFEEFVAETDERVRSRIIEMTPESMNDIYEAQWLKADAIRTGDERLKRLVADWGSTGGEDISGAKWSKYQSEAPSWMTYGDFMKLKKVEGTTDIPNPNWVGFNPAVDIQDVKLKVVMDAGRDIHDFSMWESQQRLLSRKPYLTGEVVGQADYFNPIKSHEMAQGVIAGQGLEAIDSRTMNYPSRYPTHTLDLEFQDTRDSEVNNFNRKYGLYN